MSKARTPKCKEEYVPPDDEIEEFQNEILQAGTHLSSVSGMDFPDADSVNKGVAGVLGVVERYKLVGKWVTSRVNNIEEEYMTTKQICDVSIFAFSVLFNAIRDFLLSAFLQITLQAIIECVVKLHKCFKTNPVDWRDVSSQGLELLLELDLERYRDEFPDEEDRQEEWRVAVTHKGKYATLLVGQLEDKDLRA
jgi:hypothetical protein